MDLQTYCRQRRGGLSWLAKEVGAPAQSVWQWASGVRAVPSDRCPAVEKATDGALTCEALRPDLCWQRLPDGAWPWHPGGRPLIDVTRTLLPAAAPIPSEVDHAE